MGISSPRDGFDAGYMQVWERKERPEVVLIVRNGLTPLRAPGVTFVVIETLYSFPWLFYLIGPPPSGAQARQKH